MQKQEINVHTSYIVRSERNVTHGAVQWLHLYRLVPSAQTLALHSTRSFDVLNMSCFNALSTMASKDGDSMPPNAFCEASKNAPVCASGQHAVPACHKSQKEGWMVVELCPQCAQAKHGGTGEGWCDSLQCAFLRGYDIMDSIIDILSSWCPLLEDDNNTITVELLQLYTEAEKTATGLLWQMSAIIRWVSVWLCALFLFLLLLCLVSPDLSEASIHPRPHVHSQGSAGCWFAENSMLRKAITSCCFSLVQSVVCIPVLQLFVQVIRVRSRSFHKAVRE